MNESDKRSPSELSRLEAENNALRQESLKLRQFIDSMQNLMEAVEGPKNDQEILELLGRDPRERPQYHQRGRWLVARAG